MVKGEKPIGLALVGCNSSLLYAYGPHSFRVLKGGRLVAVVDIDEDRAKRACEKLQAKRWYTDFAQVLQDDEVGAVIVVTPGWCHEEQTIAAARAGKHVLCEKPMARTIEECDRMMDACREARVTLMVAHMKRFTRAFRKVYDMIRSGHVGEVFAVRGQWDMPARHMGSDRTFRGDRRSLGGLWHDHVSHMSDLACWWLGSRAKRVHGVIRSIGEHMTAGDDFCIATLVHENGVVTCHQTTTYSYRSSYETYEIMGKQGTILVLGGHHHTSLTFEPPQVLLYDHTEGHFNARVTDVTPYIGFDVDAETQLGNHYLQELEHFCHCAQTGETPLVTGEDGRHGVEIINAMYLSHFRNSWVDLPLAHASELHALFEQYRREQEAIRQGIVWCGHEGERGT